MQDNHRYEKIKVVVNSLCAWQRRVGKDKYFTLIDDLRRVGDPNILVIERHIMKHLHLIERGIIDIIFPSSCVPLLSHFRSSSKPKSAKMAEQKFKAFLAHHYKHTCEREKRKLCAPFSREYWEMELARRCIQPDLRSAITIVLELYFKWWDRYAMLSRRDFMVKNVGFVKRKVTAMWKIPAEKIAGLLHLPVSCFNSSHKQAGSRRKFMLMYAQDITQLEKTIDPDMHGFRIMNYIMIQRETNSPLTHLLKTDGETSDVTLLQDGRNLYWKIAIKNRKGEKLITILSMRASFWFSQFMRTRVYYPTLANNLIGYESEAQINEDLRYYMELAGYGRPSPSFSVASVRKGDAIELLDKLLRDGVSIQDANAEVRLKFQVLKGSIVDDVLSQRKDSKSTIQRVDRVAWSIQALHTDLKFNENAPFRNAQTRATKEMSNLLRHSIIVLLEHLGTDVSKLMSARPNVLYCMVAQGIGKLQPNHTARKALEAATRKDIASNINSSSVIAGYLCRNLVLTRESVLENKIKVPTLLLNYARLPTFTLTK